MRRRMYDVAGTVRAGTTVVLNDDTIPIAGFEGYMSLFPTGDDPAVRHFMSACMRLLQVSYLACVGRWQTCLYVCR